MAGRVGVHLEALGGRRVGGRLQQTSTESEDLIVGCREILDEEVEVDLLRRTVRPVGLHVVRRELHADAGTWSAS